MLLGCVKLRVVVRVTVKLAVCLFELVGHGKCVHGKCVHGWVVREDGRVPLVRIVAVCKMVRVVLLC